MQFLFSQKSKLTQWNWWELWCTTIYCTGFLALFDPTLAAFISHVLFYALTHDEWTIRLRFDARKMALCLCRNADGFDQYPFIKPGISSLLVIVKLLKFTLKPDVLNSWAFLLDVEFHLHIKPCLRHMNLLEMKKTVQRSLHLNLKWTNQHCGAFWCSRTQDFTELKWKTCDQNLSCPFLSLQFNPWTCFIVLPDLQFHG